MCVSPQSVLNLTLVNG